MVVTVMAEVPLFPSLVAVIVAEPGVTPDTSPAPLTVATAVLLLDQVTVRPESVLPLASFSVALSCTVWPGWIESVAGLTETAATGTWVTVTDAVPLFPSLVAVIVAEPGVTPTTSPAPLTVATDVLLLDQETVRPESAAPFASLGVAVSWTVCPAWTVAVGGVTSTVATGTLVTVIDAVPLFPSLVAVIVAEPATTPVTRPVGLTMATDVLLLVHVTARSERAFPFASRGIAVSCTVWPTWTGALGGVRSTDTTAAGGPIGEVVRSHATTPAATANAASAISRRERRCGSAMRRPSRAKSPPGRQRSTRVDRWRPGGLGGALRVPRGSASPPFGGFALSSVLRVQRTKDGERKR